MIQKVMSFFTNNWYTRAFAGNIRFSLHPDFPSDADKTNFIRTSVYSFLLFLITYTILNLFIGAFHLDYLNKYESVMKQVHDARKLPALLYYINVYPTNIILLGLIFFSSQLLVAATAFSVLWFLGEKQRSFPMLVGITCNASVYFLLGFFGILVVSNLSPAGWQNQPFLRTIFMGIQAMFLLVGIILSSWSFFRMSRQFFQLNWGKTFLLWISPLFYLFLFFLIFLNS